MSTVPNSINLSQFNGTVLDQGQYGSCMQNALSAIISNTMRMAGQVDDPISRMWAYNDHRQAIGRFDQDSGSIAKIVMDRGVSTGFIPESEFAYTAENFTVHPTVAQYAEASQYKLVSYTSIPIEQSYTSLVASIKGQLSMGKTVLMTLDIKPWFDAEWGTPIADQVGHGDGTSRGGHAVMIDSFDDFMNVVTYDYYNRGGVGFQNSWSTGFGAAGHGTIDYGQFMPTGGVTGLYTINGYGNVNTTWSAPRQSIALEYATLLGRPADISGLDYWAGHYALGYTDAQIADILIGSGEGIALYGSDTNAQYVGDLYHAVLGRDADAGGSAYWVSRLDAGESRGTVWDAMVDMVAAPGGEVGAHDYLSNKGELSAFISIARQYNGTVYNAEVIAALASVTSDANALEIIKIGLPADLNA